MNARRNNPKSWGNTVITNKYPGTCVQCSKRVEAGKGYAVKTSPDDGDYRGGWIVLHDACPADKPQPVPYEAMFAELQELYDNARELNEDIDFVDHSVACTGAVVAETAHFELRERLDIFLPHDQEGVFVRVKNKNQLAMSARSEFAKEL